MLFGLYVRGEEAGVEYVMDTSSLPLRGYCDSVYYWGYDISYRKGSVAALSEFRAWLGDVDVLSFKPDLLSFCEWLKSHSLPCSNKGLGFCHCFLC